MVCYLSNSIVHSNNFIFRVFNELVILIGQSILKSIKIMHCVIHIQILLYFRRNLMHQDQRMSRLFEVEIGFLYDEKIFLFRYLIFQFFQTLSWFSRETYVTITRGSQPLTGLNRKCQDDNDFLNEIAETNRNQGSRFFILDARPKVNAIANKPNGGGYESYPDCELEFQNIANIHVMRESLHKLYSSVRHDYLEDKTSLNDLENYHWLTHIRVRKID